MSEIAIAECAVDPEVAAEHPGLRMFEATAPGTAARPLAGVRERLDALAGRLNGAEAVASRTRPIPQAHRRLFRHLGLDPDERRIPSEAAIVERLRRGDFRGDDRVEEALTVAVVETGVGIWALDEDRLAGPLALRPATAGELLGEGEHVDELPAGRLVVADERGPVAVLFGRLAPSHLPTRRTTTLRLFSVQAPGVPEIHVSEAFWTVLECLREPDPGVH